MKSKCSAFRQIVTVGFIGCLAFIDSGLVVPAWADDAAAQGKELFVRFGCYECHGHYGQGSSTLPRPAPTLAPKPLPLEAIKGYVRTRHIIPYTETVLSDEQLGKIHQYLESIETGPGADAIPLLR